MMGNKGHRKWRKSVLQQKKDYNALITNIIEHAKRVATEQCLPIETAWQLIVDERKSRLKKELAYTNMVITNLHRRLWVLHNEKTELTAQLEGDK
jgi:hypothetical protein